MKKLTHNQCIVQTDYWTWMISLLNMFLLTSKTNEMGYIYGKFIICLFDLSNYSTLTTKHVAYKHHLEALKLLYYIFFWNYVGWEWINHFLYWTGFCLCFGSWSYSFDNLTVHALLHPSCVCVCVCVCASKMRKRLACYIFLARWSWLPVYHYVWVCNCLFLEPVLIELSNLMILHSLYRIDRCIMYCIVMIIKFC